MNQPLGLIPEEACLEAASSQHALTERTDWPLPLGATNMDDGQIIKLLNLQGNQKSAFNQNLTPEQFVNAGLV